MKPFYNFLFLILVFRMVEMKSLKDSNTSSDALTPKKQLMRFYREEFNSLAGKICSELKVISEKILNDETLQASSKDIIQEFRKSLNHFENIYPFYVRFGLNESLATVFSNMVQDIYGPNSAYLKETDLIKQSLKSSGYDDLRQRYETELKNFFLKKFSNKFEQLKGQISNKSQLEKFEQRFSKCIEKAKECKDYECLLTNFRSNSFKLKAKFIGNLQRHLFDMFILVLQDFKQFYECVLKHPKFPQLEHYLKQDLLKTSEFTKANFEQIDSFYKIFYLGALDLMESIISEHAAEITPKQQKLIKKVFQDCGYENPLLNYQNNFAKFIQNDFIDEVENFKASFEQEGSAEEAPLIEILDGVDYSNSIAAKVMAFTNLHILDIRELKKWRL